MMQCLMWFRMRLAGADSTTASRDLRVVGQTVWTGRSSLEVAVDLRVRGPEPSAAWRPVGCARFMIVRA